MKMRINRYLSLFLLFTGAAGCVSIPKTPYVVSGGAGGEAVRHEAPCRDVSFADPSGAASRNVRGIDPEGFTLLNWNVQKAGHKDWPEDMGRLAGEADLLTLQEAYLAATLRDALRGGDFNWDMAAAFLNRKRETGVLTGSKSSPVAFCVTRFSEPLVVIPKTALTSLYPVADTHLFLLVANVHLINFTVDARGYRQLLHELEDVLAPHVGPLLLTGDFNTWSGERLAAVEEIAGQLGLSAVSFRDQGPSRFMGKRVDHVFYRGLDPVDARAVKVSSSDHNPLLVTFRIPGAER